MFCKHEWKLESSNKIESALSESVRAGRGISIRQLHPFTFNVKLIEVFSCTKCGKLKKFETELM